MEEDTGRQRSARGRKKIGKVLMAIDVGIAELLLAKQLGCDAVGAHHPIGRASVSFHRVLGRHFYFMVENGVPKTIAKKAVAKLKERVETRPHSGIYEQVIDATRALEMTLVNIHQPCDEYMRRIIFAKISEGHLGKLSDVIESISSIPEFRHSKVKPQLRTGSLDNF